MNPDQKHADTEFLTEPLWCRKRAAKFLNKSPGTLAVWDCTKRYDLKPIIIGRTVHYCPAYLRQFVAERFLKP